MSRITLSVSLSLDPELGPENLRTTDLMIEAVQNVLDLHLGVYSPVVSPAVSAISGNEAFDLDVARIVNQYRPTNSKIAAIRDLRNIYSLDLLSAKNAIDKAW